MPDSSFFLGYYAVYDDLKPTFREYLSIPSSRVKLSKKLDP
jgi:hypothetical protein